MKTKILNSVGRGPAGWGEPQRGNDAISYRTEGSFWYIGDYRFGVYQLGWFEERDWWEGFQNEIRAHFEE